MGMHEPMQMPPPSSRFSAEELAEFASSFERIKARLPRLFLRYWHRWTCIPGDTPAVLVYGEDGRLALCLVREQPDLYGAIGVTVPGHLQYWPPRGSIGEALGAAGLLL
ncbi:MAG TPA: hypothetical protein VGE22_03225 [Solimonas sp.]